MTMSVPIDIIANRTRATTAKMTPGLASRVPRRLPSKATPVRMTPTVARVAPRAWIGVERLVADEHGEHDGQPAVRRHDPADDGDRADAQAREVAEVGPRAGQADERAADDHGRVGREGRAAAPGRASR